MKKSKFPVWKICSEWWLNTVYGILHCIWEHWFRRVPVSNLLYRNHQFNWPFCMLLRLHLHHIYCKQQLSFSLTLSNQQLAICLLQEQNSFPTQMLFTMGFHKNLIKSTVLKWNTVISVDITILLKIHQTSAVTSDKCSNLECIFSLLEACFYF